jgi:hypothetical protein
MSNPGPASVLSLNTTDATFTQILNADFQSLTTGSTGTIYVITDLTGQPWYRWNGIKFVSLGDEMAPFMINANTVNLVVTGSTANVQAIGTGTNYLLTNIGTNTVFVAFGTTSGITAALATSCPVLGNSAQTFTATANAWVAAIAGSTGNTLYITTGEGE